MVPDDDCGRPVDTGIRSSPLGSFMPEGTYRPIPIVWLVSAWVVHNIAMWLLVALLTGKHPFFVVATTVMASGWVLNRTYAAGMKRAGLGWKIALVLALLLNWALAVVTALALAGY
jgi:hypothetical protein